MPRIVVEYRQPPKVHELIERDKTFMAYRQGDAHTGPWAYGRTRQHAEFNLLIQERQDIVFDAPLEVPYGADEDEDA